MDKLEEIEKKIDKGLWAGISYYQRNKDKMEGLTQGEKEVVLKYILKVFQEELRIEELQKGMGSMVGNTIEQLQYMMEGKEKPTEIDLNSEQYIGDVPIHIDDKEEDKE